MLVPPVVQGGTGDRPVGDTGVRVQQSSGPARTATLWPLAPAQPNQISNQQSQGVPPLAATPAPAHNQGVNRYGLYSLFPGGGGGSYVAATPATTGPPTSARAYHATTHKVSESVFSAAVGVGVGGYTWGAPTPPPGSPYSPVPVTQLELLAKNLANLTPPGQQALSLQGVGVNVGSLHHAQHTQHTLNLAGLHHLHHGLHQNTFSPQLSLVTGSAPTLTINSFSPNSTGNVAPTTGVLLQEYQSPTGSTTACSAVMVNGSSCPTSSTNSTMVVQGGQSSNYVVHTTGKKREAFLLSQGQPVKLENKSTKQPQVNYRSTSPGKTKVVHSDAGCSRTLPVASSWNGQDANSINGSNTSTSVVKREPSTSVPCQVAEVSTPLHATTSVKVEPLPPKSENGVVTSNASTGGIPVGIAVARQRLQHQETSAASVRNVSLSHHTSHHASYHHFQPENFGSSTAMTVGGATLVHCAGTGGSGGGEDRSTHLAISSAALAPSLNATLGSSLTPNLNVGMNSGLNSTLGTISNTTITGAATTAWPPTLWQYPVPATGAATATAAMPMEPVGIPQMGVGVQGGLQLVRDPSSGHLLLIHAAEQMQQAVVWPNYSSHSGGSVAPSPLLLPPPPSSLQLLSDIGGARLVLTEGKRKQQSTVPIVKIEADCNPNPTTIITSTESTKTLQTVTSVTGTLMPDAPLVTTLHYYPHAPALVQISQTEPTHCRSQATSPVSCLTPPPEVTTIHGIEAPQVAPIVGVQDASNQTDTPDTEEQEIVNVEPAFRVKQEQNQSPSCQLQLATSTASSSNNLLIHGAATNRANIEMPSVTAEKVCNLSRTATTTTTTTTAAINPTVCAVVGKVDKAENTIINMADCSKYSIAKDCRNVAAVTAAAAAAAAAASDRSMEHAMGHHTDVQQGGEQLIRKGNDDPFVSKKLPPCMEIRSETKIIEITEENCDSFHENLEFFSSRRVNSSVHFRNRKRSYLAGNAKERDARCDDQLVDKKAEIKEFGVESAVEDSEKTVIHHAPATKITEKSCAPENHLDSKISIDSINSSALHYSRDSCNNYAKNATNGRPQLDEPSADTKPLFVKPFDASNVNHESREIAPVVIKQETTDNLSSDCSRAARCEGFSITEKPTKDSAKRYLPERSHLGIENVVEKLKKNAAAALQEHKSDDGKQQQSNVDTSCSRVHDAEIVVTPRRLENGLKKHILRSCENTHLLESRKNVEQSSVTEMSSNRFSQTVDGSNAKNSENRKLCDFSEDSKHQFSVPKDSDKSDCASNNANNLKVTDDEEHVNRRRNAATPTTFNEIQSNRVKTFESDVHTLQKNRSERICESPRDEDTGVLLSTGIADNQNAKLKLAATAKQKSNVDLSGLELLSNSIEQFEHMKPNVKKTSNNLDVDKPLVKGKHSPEETENNNNNNVDSPLGLLCALAEQRFMEEVVDKGSKRSTNENSEEISRAGKLLLNLGKTSMEKERNRLDKRKMVESDGNYEKMKKFKVDCHLDNENSQTSSSPVRYYEKCGTSNQCNAQVAEHLAINMKENDERGGISFYRNEEGLSENRFVPVYEANGVIKSDFDERSLDFDEGKVYEHYNGSEYECYYKETKESYRNLAESEVQNCARTSSSALRLDVVGDVNGATVIRRASVDDIRERMQLVKAEAKTSVIVHVKKGQVEGEENWPNMDAVELDMRVRLADIQRQYKEKQKELSKLIPKKDDKKNLGRPRKKSHSSSTEHRLLASPTMLETMTSPQKSPSRSPDGTSSPLTSAVLTMPRCNVNLVKLGEPRSHIKLLDSIPSIPVPVPPVASPITVLPGNKMSQEDDDKSIGRMEYDTSSPAPTVASSSSASKKRKVGRPRKLMCTSGSTRHFTETIVAKKPKSKSSLVGYLLSPKNRYLQNKYIGKSGYTPLPFKTGILSLKASSKCHKSAKTKLKPVKQTPLHNKNVISSIIAEKAKFSQEVKLNKHSSKVKAKIKAESKMKSWEDEKSDEVMTEEGSVENCGVTENCCFEEKSPEIMDTIERESDLEEKNDEYEKFDKKKQKCSSTSSSRHKSGERIKKASKRRKSSECKECAKSAKVEKTESIVNRCKLTSAHLAIDQLRVLTAMGGLFYAGKLSAVQAPDVYAITLDGERGNRPHIHSREEILRDAIVEVCPSSTKELPPGTRLCAYWSQQYRCLYPGTSVEPSEPDPELDEKFVSVEFDDGDSGRIALDDIRLLQPDYPVVEYDPNPLLTLGKRRRQTSTSTDDKRSSVTNSSIATLNRNNSSSTVSSTVCPFVPSSDGKLMKSPKNDEVDSKMLDEYRERKRLKKRRKDKLKRLHETQEGKKKRRRHKCCEERKKHKHRKHRKHKHKHSHHCSHSDGNHISSEESCCGGQKSEDEPNEDNFTNDNKNVEEEYKIVKQQQCETILGLTEKLTKETKIEKPKKSDKKGKTRERQESIESRSKMAAFLPARQLWGWSGKGYRRPGAKGRAKKQFFRAIQRGSEIIQIGDSAVFLSTGRPDRPYIGRIESMWETSSSNMIVKVKWFYHPEETVGCPTNLKYPGALFESPHMDENDVQTISHKCEVLPLNEYTEKLGKEPHRYLTIYDNNDIYYLAGYYDPTTYLLSMQPGVV